MARNVVNRRNYRRELEIFRAVVEGTSVGVVAYRNRMTRQRVCFLVERTAQGIMAMSGFKLPTFAFLNVRSMRGYSKLWLAGADRYEPTVIPPTTTEEVA